MLRQCDFVADRMIERYLETFPAFNNWQGTKQRDETPKWTALQVFQENWNIDAEDFGAMWKQSVLDVFLNAPHHTPKTGISYLLKFPEEVDFVREAFRKLFSEDGGDIDARQDRINEFLETVNSHILNHVETTMFLQKIEDVITYLNLYDPTSNYRYKYTPASLWAKYTGYSGFEGGQFFSLKNYYRMCDLLLERVCINQKLLETHSIRFNNDFFTLKDYDTQLHVLTFDVLYCSWDEEVFFGKAVSDYKAYCHQEKLKQLNEELVQAEDSLKNLKSALIVFDPTGEAVRHLKLGRGTVLDVDFESSWMNVQFGERVSRLKYPLVFLNGSLKGLNVDIRGILEAQNSVLVEKETKIRELKDQINRLS